MDLPQERIARRLNHVEFVHRPGERELVRTLFDLLGIETRLAMGGRTLIGVIDPPTFNPADNENYIAGGEVDPEQWRFDQALAEAVRREPLADAFNGYMSLLERKPPRGMHFGVNFSTLEAWEAAVARVADVEARAPSIARRVRLLKAFRPDDPEPLSPVHQAFIWTDIIASGSLALGQRIELAALVGDLGDAI
jgi:hypothetical protein